MPCTYTRSVSTTSIMEEPQQGSQGAEDRSQKTAAALRALREGLGTKLDTHRRRMTDLETDLNTRVLQIAEELAQEQAAESQAELLLHEDHLRKLRESLTDREGTIIKLQRQISDAELKQLRLSAELAEARSAIESVRIEECQDCSRLRTELAGAQARSKSTEAELEQLAEQIERSAQDLTSSQQALVTLQQAECQDCTQLRTELAGSQQQTATVVAELQGLTNEYERANQELANSRQALEALREAECPDCSILRTELAEAQTQTTAADAELQELTAQIERATLDLASAQQEVVALRETGSQDTAKLRAELADAQALSTAADVELQSLTIEAERSARDLASAQQQLEALREGESQESALLRTNLADAEARFDAADTELQDLKKELERSAQELAKSQQALETLRDAECSDCTHLRAELTESLQKSIATDTQVQELLAEVEHSRKKLAESQEALDYQITANTEDTQQLELQLAALEKDAADSDKKLKELETQVAQLTLELAQSRDAESKLVAQHNANDNALAESRSAAEEANQALAGKLLDLATQRDALAEQLTQVQAELTAREESDASELSWLERECESAEQGRKQLATEFEDLLKQHKSTEESLQAATLQSEQVVAKLKKAEEQLLALTNSTEHEEALEQAQRKFELALADAQKLKRENAELQEELQGRPEKSETESPELVSLRVERDALASRVAELEAAPVQVVDHDSEQQLSDLRRRFELAVDDLRHLKQENAQLQDKLSKAPQGGGSGHVHVTAMDWQSQKARLLASLESEDVEEQTAERREELTTIEGTISITDRIVADKDREIAELKAELADQSFAAVESVSVETEVVNKDELIQAERAKLEAMQKELHDKLRTAEMEMSIQRATLARREAELQQKLQAATQAQADAPVGADGKPRRKWLSALGIRDDDEKK